MKELIALMKERLNKLKKTLAPMTPVQRLDHLWTYYKGVLFVIGIVAMIGYITYTGIANANIETLISGVYVNVKMDTAGSAYVTDDYFAHLEGVKGEQIIDVSHSYFGELTSTKEVEYSYNAAMKVIALVTAQQLDYIVADDIGFAFYITYDVFMDLRDILTEDEMSYWEPYIIYYEAEGQERVPVALNIQETAFYKKFLSANENNIYLSFIVNTLRKDTCRDFWDYLMALETAS